MEYRWTQIIQLCESTCFLLGKCFFPCTILWFDMYVNRLQVLTPLSLLINIATFAVATFVVSPGLSKISKLHPTPISPSPTLVGIYVVAIFAGQIGYCVLLVLASKAETKVHSFSWSHPMDLYLQRCSKPSLKALDSLL
jgi:hypothetical protein